MPSRKNYLISPLKILSTLLYYKWHWQCPSGLNRFLHKPGIYWYSSKALQDALSLRRNLKIQERKHAFDQEIVLKKNDEENFRMAQTLHTLRLATIRGSLEDIKSTLSKGVTVNQPLKGGWTALMYACSLGHPSIVEYLLKHGANPNFHKELFTPLMAVCASTQKNEDRLVHCVELLLQHKADVNMTERHHISALMFAAREGHVKVVERLLTGNCQCDMDAQDNQGWTALFWAANQRKAKVVQVLVRKGAKVDIKDTCGQTVINLAINKGFDEILAILTKKQAGPIEIQEKNQAHDLTDSKTKNKFGKGADAMLQALLEELSTPNINNNNRSANSFKKFINSLEFENHLDVLKAHQIISKIANSVNGCFQNSILFSQNPSVKQCKSVETSWKNVPYSAIEAQAVLEQTVRHLECLFAGVSYMRLHTQTAVGPVLLEDKHAKASELTALSDRALRYSRLLYDELYFFNRYTKQLDGSDVMIPADFVKERNSASDTDATHTALISTAVVAAAVFLILFNTRTITLSFFSK